MDAVVLAGGEVPEQLRASQTAQERALIQVGGRPIVELVVDSLLAAPEVDRVILVSTPKALELMGDRVLGIPSGNKMTQNLLLGARAASSPQILIVTGDIPLVRTGTWAEFIGSARQRNLEAAYPVVRRQVVSQQFPGGKRTYGNLKDGSFTGGNAFLFGRDRLDSLESLIDRAFASRKNPFKLAGMLGMGFILRALTKQLTVPDVERKLSDLLQCHAGAVEMQDASIAFDVDKPVDLKVAERQLSARNYSG